MKIVGSSPRSLISRFIRLDTLIDCQCQIDAKILVSVCIYLHNFAGLTGSTDFLWEMPKLSPARH